MEDIFEELAAAGSGDEGIAEESSQQNGGNKDDEAEEANDTKRVVKPKRVVSRPRPKLDPARLLGPRGIFLLTSTFEGIKFNGKGHELDDLNNILSRLQHWAHRLFPKMTFEDCIERIEELGNKREIQTNMHKIRNGMIDLNPYQTGQDADDEGVNRVATPPPDDDPFDQLVAPAPTAPQTTLTEEQRARMLRNRLLAEERRMARRLAREKELEGQRRNSDKTLDGEDTRDAVHSSEVPNVDPPRIEEADDTQAPEASNTSLNESLSGIDSTSNGNNPSSAQDSIYQHTTLEPAENTEPLALDSPHPAKSSLSTSLDATVAPAETKLCHISSPIHHTPSCVVDETPAQTPIQQKIAMDVDDQAETDSTLGTTAVSTPVDDSHPTAISQIEEEVMDVGSAENWNDDFA